MSADKTIEEAIARIEEIVSQLGDSSVTLENSLHLYTEGMKLSQLCLTQIEQAEQVVEQYSAEPIGPKGE